LRTRRILHRATPARSNVEYQRALATLRAAQKRGTRVNDGMRAWHST